MSSQSELKLEFSSAEIKFTSKINSLEIKLYICNGTHKDDAFAVFVMSKHKDPSSLNDVSFANVVTRFVSLIAKVTQILLPHTLI